MNNKEIARIFSEITDLLEIRGENPFKIRAYQKAARILDNLPESLEALHREGKLETLDGVGKGIAEKIAEALDTGQIQYHQELLQSVPEGLLSLLTVPGMGPKKAKLVYDQLGIATIADLKKAAEAEQLRSLPGMGQKSEEKILKGILNLEQASGRFTLGAARPIAEEILGRIRAIQGVKEAQYAGSLRRGRETVGDVDLLVSTKNGAAVMNEFLATPNIREVLAQGDTKSSVVLTNGLQVDLRVVPGKSFGAALQYFTGSKGHNIQLRELAVRKKLKVNEYGVFEAETDKPVAGKKEEDVYKALGLAWIPPELREGLDEIELARDNALPVLLERKDIRAALHNHTTASDGSMPLEDLVEEAERRGFEFIAVTDHSGSLGVANGLTPDRLKRQIEAIHQFNEKHKGIRVLAGTEVDIRADGSLDYPDDLLEQLDLVIAAIHSSFEQPKERMTPRICGAMENPHVDIISHPTGRLINRRPRLEIDLERLFSTAAETDTVLEINAHYLRLDLNDEHIREAKRHGVKFSLDTDTHAVNDFDNLDFGIQTARRGRLGPADVINTLPLDEFLKWINNKK